MMTWGGKWYAPKCLIPYIHYCYVGAEFWICLAFMKGKINGISGTWKTEPATQNGMGRNDCVPRVIIGEMCVWTRCMLLSSSDELLRKDGYDRYYAIADLSKLVEGRLCPLLVRRVHRTNLPGSFSKERVSFSLQINVCYGREKGERCSAISLEMCSHCRAQWAFLPGHLKRIDTKSEGKGTLR